jgi:DNA-binding response OmpR family regulator
VIPLVIDADDRVRLALASEMEREWRECRVVTARDGAGGLEAFRRHAPDLVLLDMDVSGPDGWSVLRTMRLESDVPLIAFSASTSDADLVHALALGADDFVRKPFGRLALLARIKAVLRRARLPAPLNRQPDFEVGDLAISFQDRRVTLRGEPVSLTPLEYELLHRLIQSAGRLVTRDALAGLIWGDDRGAGAHQLKAFVCRLRRKLWRPGAPPLIQTVHGLGYRFAGPGAAQSAAPEARPADGSQGGGSRRMPHHQAPQALAKHARRSLHLPGEDGDLRCTTAA